MSAPCSKILPDGTAYLFIVFQFYGILFCRFSGKLEEVLDKNEGSTTYGSVLKTLGGEFSNKLTIDLHVLGSLKYVGTNLVRFPGCINSAIVND